MATEAIASEGVLAAADGTKLAYRAWPRPQATITFAVVHGLGDHAGRYAAFADAMGARGMATFALDLRGHGKSAGQRGHVDSWSQWTDDFAGFVRHVEGLVQSEVVPLGHSFGGAVLLSTVLDGKLANCKRFIVSSPALKVKVAVPEWKISLGRVSSTVMPRLALDNEVHADWLSRIPEVVEAYRTDPLVHSKISARLYTEWLRATQDILDRATQIREPFLILAGADDRLIDPAGSVQLSKRTPSWSELQVLPGRYHEPFNDLGSDEVFGIIERWLKGS